MKHLSLLSLLTILVFGSKSYAQPAQGDLILDGNIYINHSRSTSESSVFDIQNESTYSRFNFSVSPGLGVLLNENHAVGANLQYSFSSSRTDSGSDTENSLTEFTAGISPYFSKFCSLGNSFYLRTTARLEASTGTSKQKLDGEVQSESSVISLGARISPSLNFFIKDRFALSAGFGSLSYTWQERKPKNQDEDSESVTRTGNGRLDLTLNSFNVGFYYLIKKKDEG